MHQIGVRWKTVSRSTSGAISGMIWTAEAPVPMIATRLPRRSTSSSQRAVCIVVPRKEARPSISGGLGWVRTPVAPITKRAVISPPSASASRQTCSSSSKAAPVTRVLKRTFSRTPYLSARSRA